MRDLAICQGSGNVGAARGGISEETKRDKILADLLTAVEKLSSRAATQDSQINSLQSHISTPAHTLPVMLDTLPVISSSVASPVTQFISATELSTTGMATVPAVENTMGS